MYKVLKKHLFLLLFFVFVHSCEDPLNPPVELLAPSIEIGNMNTDNYFVGETIEISATTNDVDGYITKVIYYNKSIYLGETSTRPFNYEINNALIGDYIITAKAIDNDNNETISNELNFYVNNNPEVSLSLLDNNSNFITGETITFTTSITDSNSEIEKVQFYEGENLIGEVYDNPYSYIWSNPDIGNYYVTAKVIYTNSEEITSQSINITVNRPENQLPTVSLSSPTEDTQFYDGDNISLVAEASDPDGSVFKVEFYNNEILIAEDFYSPYQYLWTDVEVGTYNFTAKVIDSDNTTSVSENISISVNERINISPTVSITSPANSTTFIEGSSITITANAVDSDGSVSNVEFYNGLTLLGQDNSYPYQYTIVETTPGNYSLTAKVFDNNFESAISDTINVTVNPPENIPPTVNISSPSDDSIFTELDTVTITVNASDIDGDITRVLIYSGDTILTELNTTPYEYSIIDISPGAYEFSAIAYDNDGDETISNTISITVNEKINIPPVITLTSPSDGESFIEGVEIILQAEASDSDGFVSKVEFYQNATLLGDDNNSPYTYEWNNFQLGTYVITAKVYDDLGLTINSESISINIVEPPNQFPSIEITSPNNNNTFIEGDNITVTVSATDTDGSISSVEFYNGNEFLGEDFSEPYEFIISNSNTGGYSLTAKVIDDDNAVTTSEPISITVNPPANIPPEITITSHENSEVVTYGSDILLTVDATDSDGYITKVEFFSGDSLLGHDSTAPFEYTWSDVDSGTYDLTCIAYDDDGDSTPSSTTSIFVNIYPTISITSPAGNSNFVEQDSINIEIDASDSDGTVQRVDFYNGDTLIGQDFLSPYSYEIPSAEVGSYTISARVIDDIGSENLSETVTVIVNENTIPTISLTAPTDGDYLDSGQTLLLIADAEDSDGSISKVEFYNGLNKLGEVTSEPYEYSYIDISKGSYNFSAKVYDNLNASSTSSNISVTINSPPAVEIQEGDITINNGQSQTFTVSASDIDNDYLSYQWYVNDVLQTGKTSTSFSLQYQPVITTDYIVKVQVSDGDLTNETEVTLTVKGNTIVGFVKDSNNNPVSGALVQLNDNDSYNQQTVSDENGYYEFFDMPGGSYYLSATRDHFTYFSTTVTVASSNLTITSPDNNSVVEVGDSIYFSVNVTNAEYPVVEVEFYDGETLLGVDDRSPYSYRIYDLEAGNHSFRAIAYDILGNSISVGESLVYANSPPTVSITEDPATIESGDTIVYSAVANDIDGDDLTYQWYINNSIQEDRTTNIFPFTPNPSSTTSYTIMVLVSDGRKYANDSVVVTVNGNKIFGYVVDENSNTIGGALVQLYNDNYRSETVSDTNGYYEFDNLPEGTYYLVAIRDDYTLLTTIVTVD